MSLRLQVTLAKRPGATIVVHSIILWRCWLLGWRHSQLDITRMGCQYRGHGFGFLIGQLAPLLWNPFAVAAPWMAFFSIREPSIAGIMWLTPADEHCAGRHTAREGLVLRRQVTIYSFLRRTG